MSVFARTSRFFVTSIVASTIASVSTMALASNSAGEWKYLSSTAEERESVNLTIYHDNFAVVRDVRNVVLPKGKVSLEYTDISQFVSPASVITKSLSHPEQFHVQEQSYHYDLLNRDTLLEAYLGRKLKYSRSILQGDTYEKILREGVLLSTNPEIVKFGDQIEISPEGVISLPNVPEALSIMPTLYMKVENDRTGPQQIETSYITQNISWKADYVMDLLEESSELNLTAWITLNNQSGTSYRNARVRLLAGEVNREPVVGELSYFDAPKRSLMAAEMAAPLPEARSQVDYYSFDLDNTTDVLTNETKQVRLFDVKHVPFERRYKVVYQTGYGPNGEENQVQANVELGFENTEAVGLGLPLPQGSARAYVEDTGHLTLVGEAGVSHASVGDRFVMQMGKAFDISAKQKQLTFRRLGDRQFEASFEVLVKNAREEAVPVTVQQKQIGQWQVIAENIQGERVNATTQEYVVTVPPEGDRVITYTIRWEN